MRPEMRINYSLDAGDVIEIAMDLLKKANVPTFFVRVLSASKKDDLWEVVMEDTATGKQYTVTVNPKDEMVSLKGLTLRVKEHLDLANKYKVDFNEAIERGDIEKADESLWRLFSCFMTALSLIRRGRPARSDDDVVNVGMELAKTLGDEMLERAIKYIVKYHTLAYYSVLDLEDMKEYYQAVVYVIQKTYEFVEKILSQIYLSLQTESNSS